ncbi:MAG: hypothetical protein FD161_1813 [Limisphaerales bacterium]|nr:MAG: hypothetical protein FD161_1813 [Limisphaerales bacterium]TXT47783.1 MAG: hypothetical protein FD140_4056 [Limisphaerales bacterium]
MQTNPSSSSHISDSGVTVPISHRRGEYIVRYRDGQRARSRAFERLEQAREFARFLARRQHWAQVAEELAARFVAPVRSFRVAPTTSTLMAFDCFLRAMRRNGASQANIGTVVAVLSAAFSHVSAGDLGALSAAWYREQDARSQEQLRTKDARARRRVIVAKFLGWLAHQPLEPQAHVAMPTAPAPEKKFLTVAESEQLLRACPDDNARRYAALSLFAGLRPVEVAALRWEDITEQRDGLFCRSKGLARVVPLSVNLLAWLQPPTPAQGRVVTAAAARKVRALLANLKPTAPNVLRMTCLLCWLALHGLNVTASYAGLSHDPQERHLRLPISVADAERFFSLAPV